jgi:hypothetical protein
MTAIKNRLKTVEKKMNITNSEFCECFPQGSEIWQQTITDDGTAYTEPILTSEPIPDFCTKCGKPTNRQKIIICFGDLEHPLQEPPNGAVEDHKQWIVKRDRQLAFESTGENRK